MFVTWIAAALFLYTAATPAEAAQGFLGISYTIEGDKFIPNRLARRVLVNNLVLGSPAAKAGLRIGDEILEVDGRKLAGSRLSELKPLLDKQAGHSLHLVVKTQTGEVKSFRVVLAERPLQ